MAERIHGESVASCLLQRVEELLPLRSIAPKVQVRCKPRLPLPPRAIVLIPQGGREERQWRGGRTLPERGRCNWQVKRGNLIGQQRWICGTVQEDDGAGGSGRGDRTHDAAHVPRFSHRDGHEASPTTAARADDRPKGFLARLAPLVAAAAV